MRWEEEIKKSKKVIYVHLRNVRKRTVPYQFNHWDEMEKAVVFTLRKHRKQTW